MNEMRKAFMSRLSEEVLLKETGQLVPGTEHTFLGRRVRHNGDSIDVCMSQTYIDSIFGLVWNEECQASCNDWFCDDC